MRYDNCDGCGCDDVVEEKHTNILLDLNNIPYLLGSYLDKRTILPVASNELRNEIFIDQTERNSMKTVINVNIADLPTRSTTDMPFVFGNNQKKDFMERDMAALSNELNHQLDVLLPGIVVRINYQLENYKTGRLVSSMSEDLPITDAVYGYFINPNNYTDNCILSNFSDTLISSINAYAYGRQPMTFRITDIKLLYKKLSRFTNPHEVKRHVNRKSYDYGIYQYHEKLQSRHTFGDDGRYYHREAPEAIAPPEWSMFSRFYHFDNRGHDIVLHMDEIMSPQTQIMEVPCGTTRVNRCFTVNPGQRIIFKISIWKNDIVVVNDAEWVAKALKSPCLDAYEPLHSPIKHGCNSHGFHHMDEVVMKDKVDHRQDHAIMDTNRRIDELTEVVNRLARAIVDKGNPNIDPNEELDPGFTVPSEERIPVRPHRGKPDRHIKGKIAKLEESIKNLQSMVGNTEEDHQKFESDIELLMSEIDDIRENGVDETVAEHINEIESTLINLKEAVENSEVRELSDEELSELIDKINGF